jgi:hypothetical protein
MDPYRSPPPERARVDFGDPRRAVRSMVLGFALIALSAAIIAAWARWGGRIHSSVLLPAVFGVVLLMRATWGTVELQRDRGVLSVARRGLVRRGRDDLPLAEVETIEIVPTSFRDEKPDYVLNLTLAGGRKVRLLRATTMAALEPDHEAIAAFLVEHGLLWGGRTRGPTARVSAAPAPQEPGAEDVEASARDHEVGRG